ncbi:UNVERIFIED_CONTAM: hypothetical protein FKN15_045039 [Acipenser sinensis]
MRRKRCRQQQLQQQQQESKRWWSRGPTRFGPTDWASEQEQWRREGAPMSGACGEFGQVWEDCPYRDPQYEEVWNQGLVGDAAEWFWAVDWTRPYPEPKREEPEHPAPEWEEPKHPAPEWEEPEHPAPEWEEPKCLVPEWEEPEPPQPKRGESVHPQPKRGESVRPQPKRGESVVHNPRGGRPNVHSPGTHQQRENICWFDLHRHGRTA